MSLSPHDVEMFFKLQRAVYCDVNQRLKVLPGECTTLENAKLLTPEKRVRMREALLANKQLLDSFASDNPLELPAEELDIVRPWHHAFAGKFYILRILMKHAIFLTADNDSRAYGVSALTQPFEEIVGPKLPILIETAILPFRDVIVYDSVCCSYNVSFGPGIRRNLNDKLKQARLNHGLITSLPVSDVVGMTAPPERKQTTSLKKSSEKAKPNRNEASEILEQLALLTDTFCRTHLNKEYAELCRKLIGKLSQKRPSPLLTGNLSAWACGIVRTIGWVNFLNDPTQTPHLKLSEIDEAFGVSNSTASARSAAIRKMFKMIQLDPAWSRPSTVDQNPMAWLIKLNGFLVDVRTVDRSIQEEAFRKGLIPYLPTLE